jgi:peptidoglycan/xylan/chitin deacetylase (PgdA/CDA1 family)
MKRRLKELAYAALYFSGAVHLAYWLNRRAQVVVTYHNVLPDGMIDDSLHALEAHGASVFQRQLALIARRFPITTELNKPGTCLITFDDGYRNNFKIAAPLLAKHGALAYFFVPVAITETGETLWVDQFRLWLGAAPSGSYVIAGTTVALGDNASRHEAAKVLWRLIEADYDARLAILGEMNRLVPFERLPIDPKLRSLRYGGVTAEQLEALARAGHRIGAHSLRHDILSRLSPAELEKDFAACAAQLGVLYTTPVYAYPFGGIEHLGERVIDGCARAGFAAAFIYLPTLDATGMSPGPFTMPRLTLPNTASRFVIEAKLSGAEAMLRDLVRKARRRFARRLGVGLPAHRHEAGIEHRQLGESDHAHEVAQRREQQITVEERRHDRPDDERRHEQPAEIQRGAEIGVRPPDRHQQDRHEQAEPDIAEIEHQVQVARVRVHDQPVLRGGHADDVLRRPEPLEPEAEQRPLI